MHRVTMKPLEKNQMALLVLIRTAIWGGEEDLPDADWDVVEKYAQDQGVLWIVYLGAKALKQSNCSLQLISKERLKNWRSALYTSAFYNDQINGVQMHLIQWMAENKVRAAILKGTSCSRYYPFPEARPLGDIDVLVDRECVNAVGEYLESRDYTKSQHEHGFHVGYYGTEATVEVHYAGTSIPNSAGGRAVAEEMAHFLDDTQMACIGKMTFPVLSDTHQALMLLLHMERHMIDSGIGLRQLCDWAVFVNGTAGVTWKKDILELLNRCGLLVYAKVLTKVCVLFLGLDATKVEWCLDTDDELARAMMEDVFRGGSMGVADTEGMGSLFTDRAHMGDGRQTKLKGLLGRLTRLAYQHFPYTQRYKILLPVFWIYIPMRYLVRSLVGIRPKKRILAVYREADQRQKLFKALRLYEVDDDRTFLK